MKEDFSSWLDRAEASASKFFGSRLFIGLLTLFNGAWMSLNVVAVVKHWDPYPFVLLNLIFSEFSLYMQPLIIMTQNRQERRAALEAIEKEKETDEYRRRLQVILESIAAHAPVVLDNSTKLDVLVQLFEDMYDELKEVTLASPAPRARDEGHAPCDGVLPRPRSTPHGVPDFSPHEGESEA